MVVLNFSLTPETAARVHDVLVCLGKFSDTVAFEARKERLTLTALNSSKSAYASFTLDATRCFESYEFNTSQSGSDGRFTFRMYSKALLSVFKGRLYDPLGRDGAIDRCEVSIQDRPDETHCRFIVKMICNQGVVKTYKLTYESVEVMHALFDANAAKNRWRINSGVLREYIEYFGTKTEMLDIFAGEDGRAVFKSYTEKITNGKEILKHPLVTAVAVNTSDFAEFDVQPGLHIIISVKDFKAIVTHADTLKSDLRANYSVPTRPLKFWYGNEHGILGEFTLMTSGDYQGGATPTPIPQQMPSRAASRAHSASVDNRSFRSDRSEMPPPSEPASRLSARRRATAARRQASPKPVESNPDSLFVNDEEEDAQWEPVDYNEEEETLGWDASTENANTVFPTFRDSGTLSRTETEDENVEAVAPTQRVSQVQGLW
ncbi:DNA repair protein Rad9 [Aaosphaeria arxii CBS 175.79]|uniref:DNA repair protein rad9 n=1 Tax=Aaosphaeria arxii CBS 175.79 TaxID=1450172 RepID=A0A6A5XUI7_9PLEO|nr:DNA repair protein Rad9 [Aaosphaeria arxii CBS 175.79]KAF2016300.1 DNA repair protein Rad9 [Aaosphaeria arxii CBS 175.79]